MKPKITEQEAYEIYDDMLNECTPNIQIGYIEFEASKLLAEHDPIAYRTGFNDYLDIINEDYDTSDWY